jgi:hypothetical protein
MKANTAQQGFDVAVDRFGHPQGNLGSAVVQDSIQMAKQHIGQFLQGFYRLRKNRMFERARLQSCRKLLKINEAFRPCGMFFGRLA